MSDKDKDIEAEVNVSLVYAGVDYRFGDDVGLVGDDFRLGRVRNIVMRSGQNRVEVELDGEPTEGMDFEGPYQGSNVCYGYFAPEDISKFDYQAFYENNEQGLREQFGIDEALIEKNM